MHFISCIESQLACPSFDMNFRRLQLRTDGRDDCKGIQKCPGEAPLLARIQSVRTFVSIFNRFRYILLVIFKLRVNFGLPSFLAEHILLQSKF